MVQALLVALLAGLATSVGGLLAMNKRTLDRRYLAVALAFAAGAMLMVSMGEILPKGVAANMGLVKVAEQGSDLMRLPDWQVRNEWRQRIALLNAALTQGREALAVRLRGIEDVRDGES